MNAAPDRYPRWGLWVAACAAAETIGMTAAAGAARLASGSPPAWGLVLIVIGGLVEGTALGVLQAAVLSRWLPTMKRGLWIGLTVVVAGLGWAAASAPSQLQPPAADDGSPSAWVVIGGGAALGVVMGVVLGFAQSFPLRGAVRHPFRWMLVSAIAWAPTMAIIFLGATTPGATWNLLPVLLIAAATGAIAGATLGLVSAPLFPLLNRESPDPMPRSAT
jgi:hypothetical protein